MFNIMWKIIMEKNTYMGFPDDSVGKESSCNAGDPGSMPGWGRSPGEGRGCPLQYSWASLGAQLVKNPPAMWETWFRPLGWEDPLEKGKATQLTILAGKSQGERSLAGYSRKESDTAEWLTSRFTSWITETFSVQQKLTQHCKLTILQF